VLLLMVALLCVTSHTEVLLVVEALDSGEVGALREMQAEWGVTLHWKGAPSCAWTGLTCDAAQHVTQLDLGGKRLSGSIPDSINGLQWLQCLDLSLSQLEGVIPSSQVASTCGLESQPEPSERHDSGLAREATTTCEHESQHEPAEWCDSGLNR
jgi:hypothetical protein